jgi:capsule polysaccharide export protein KpsE/RkpR
MSDVFSAIFRLEGDFKPIDQGLDNLNAKYGKTASIQDELRAKVAALGQEEAKWVDARSKLNNPTVAAQYTQKITELRTQITALTGEIKKEGMAVDGVNKSFKMAGDQATITGMNIAKAFNTTGVNAMAKAADETNQELKKVGETAKKNQNIRLSISPHWTG